MTIGTDFSVSTSHSFTGPDSLVVRASALGAVNRGSGPGCAIPKALKTVLVAPLLTLALKGSARR